MKEEPGGEGLVDITSSSTGFGIPHKLPSMEIQRRNRENEERKKVVDEERGPSPWLAIARGSQGGFWQRENTMEKRDNKLFRKLSYALERK